MKSSTQIPCFLTLAHSVLSPLPPFRHPAETHLSPPQPPFIFRPTPSCLVFPTSGQTSEGSCHHHFLLCCAPLTLCCYIRTDFRPGLSCHFSLYLGTPFPAPPPPRCRVHCCLSPRRGYSSGSSGSPSVYPFLIGLAHFPCLRNLRLPNHHFQP